MWTEKTFSCWKGKKLATLLALLWSFQTDTSKLENFHNNFCLFFSNCPQVGEKLNLKMRSCQICIFNICVKKRTSRSLSPVDLWTHLRNSIFAGEKQLRFFRIPPRMECEQKKGKNLTLQKALFLSPLPKTECSFFFSNAHCCPKLQRHMTKSESFLNGNEKRMNNVF